MRKGSQKPEVRSQKSRASIPERRAPSSESPALSTQPLLLEIGCEEIPARFLTAAQKDFGERLAAALTELRLVPAGDPSLTTYSTPRRLVAFVPRVLAQQLDRVEETTGPPVKVSFDAAGKPTRAAESFAEKSGVKVMDLIRVTTGKGEYLAARKTVSGQPALALLGEALPGVISSITLPKSMYWTAKAGLRFFRPVRWTLALLGEGKSAKVVPFEIAGAKSGNATFGHRASGSRSIPVSSFASYGEKLRAAQVEIDPEARQHTIRETSKALLEPSERLVEDAELETWHVNSSEWPSAIRGAFNQKFLRLPREILITVMRDHQKYFAVEGKGGDLKPGFIAILNRQNDPKEIIRAGHERVLRARFTDAEFFWDTDQKIPLRDRTPLLEKVTYHEKLGSYGDKVRRMEAIANGICFVLRDQGKMSLVEEESTKRAVKLCKCDLTTQMVKEFTELQGIVGGLYAKVQGERAEVADAIYDQYLPLGAEDKCPRSIVGAIVSLADKLDTIVAGFGAGLEPSGSSDPFGLRRAGNRAVKLLMEFEVPCSVEECPGLQSRNMSDDVKLRLHKFIQERLQYYLETDKGFRFDTVRAVLGRRSELADQSPFTALKIAESLEAIRGTEDFLALTSAAKRIRNILKKSATDHDWQPGVISENLLSEAEERELFKVHRAVIDRTSVLEISGQYKGALEIIASLRPVVDRFFDKVLVMAEDKDVRQNRLRQLNSLDKTFTSIADLSQIESSASTVGAPTKEKAATNGMEP